MKDAINFVILQTRYDKPGRWNKKRYGFMELLLKESLALSQVVKS